MKAKKPWNSLKIPRLWRGEREFGFAKVSSLNIPRASSLSSPFSLLARTPGSSRFNGFQEIDGISRFVPNAP